MASRGKTNVDRINEAIDALNAMDQPSTMTTADYLQRAIDALLVLRDYAEGDEDESEDE